MNAKRDSIRASVICRLAAIAMLTCWLAVHVPPTHAEIYSWSDESGNLHFTDTAETVPQKYRNKVTVDDDSVPRNWEYLASAHGVDYYYDDASVTYANRNRHRILVKESYAASGREEYETQIMLDCARQLYKPLQSVKLYKEQRSPVDLRGMTDDAYMGRDGYLSLTYPFQILSRMICRDSVQ